MKILEDIFGDVKLGKEILSHGVKEKINYTYRTSLRPSNMLRKGQHG